MSRQIARAVAKAANGAPPPAPPVAAESPAPPTVNGQPVNIDPRIPREATLRVSAKHLQVIYAALDELPGKFGREVYTEISRQCQEQIDAALKATPSK